MSSEREKEIFFEALDLGPEARVRLLDDRCAGAPELRGAVERLLRAHDLARDFLGAPTIEDVPTAGAFDARPGPEAEPGDVIGAYRLVSVLGEGGFGRVFLAEQTEPVTRLVALKLLKAGMDSRKIVARFEAERQALAVMDHPGVARVFDGGQAPNGRPYFVMEYVRGEPITTYCQRKALSVRERLELFESVCLAVQHAHNKGIVHRDLKPSNVLVATVDDKPAPKVIDFGIAKALGDSSMPRAMVTMEGQMVGTPAYMSPEQVSGQAGMDTRSDVYTLGVLLYELLTGTLPIEPERLNRLSPVAMLEAVRQHTPEKPSTRVSRAGESGPFGERGGAAPRHLAGRLRGDLDWIVMRALEKEPERRYQTAFALARDVRRHLEGEPVEAGPPSGWYRLRKFAERHRGELAAAAVVLVALVGGLISSLVFATRSEHSRRLAEREGDMASETALFAESMLSGLDPAVARGADTTLLRRMLDDSIERLRSSPPAHAETEARLRRMIGTGLFKIAAFNEAFDQFHLALRLARSVLPQDDPFVLDTWSDLAKMYAETSRFDEARREMQGVLEAKRRALGEDDPSTLDAQFTLAFVDRLTGRLEEARAGFEDVIYRRTRVLGDQHKDTMSARNSLATVLGELGHTDQAIELYEQVIAFQRKELGEDHPHTLATMNNLADDLAETGRQAEALALLEEVLAIKRRVMEPNHPSLLITVNNLAGYYGTLGRLEEAERMYREAGAIAEQAFGPGDWRTMAIWNNLSSHLLKRVNRPEEARVILERIMPVCRETLGPSHRLSLAIRSNLCGCLLAANDVAAALTLSSELVEDADAALPEGHPDRAGYRLTFARALLASERWREAGQLLDEALGMCTEDAAMSDMKATAARLLGDFHERCGRLDEAARWRGVADGGTLASP
ncbi:MAG: serine/threonine-protein kinase [Phycisphaerales bacterium]|nr:serine/threonine-protein kinase [Phycisphaerales bacterium]